jgi:hypothetical protein
MAIERVVWEMFSGGVHRNAFDSDIQTDPQRWTGYHGDLVGDTTTLVAHPEGPRIGGETSQSFLTLPVAAVTPGDSWEGTWALGQLDLTGEMQITATEVGDDRVVVEFAGTGSGVRTATDLVKIDIVYTTDAEISGRAVIDAATGWVESMSIDIAATGTIEVTSTGFWNEVRPLAGSAELQVGVPMPVTYQIHIETTTLG